LKIIHFSDLHFSHFVLNPLQFLNKTWIGNANLLLKRGKKLQPITKDFILNEIQKIDPDLILITGDFTTTSQKNEFLKAQQFVSQLENHGLKVLKIPGNHDHYTKKAYSKKIFYDFLSNESAKTGNLKTEGFELYSTEECNLILLDLTQATPWFTAYGVFSSRLENNLTKTLRDLDKQKPLVIAGHFPILKNTQDYHHALKNGKKLLNMLESFETCFYLHGHNHNFNIIHFKNVIHIDSGSLSDVQKGSFSVLDTQTKQITPFFREMNTFSKGQVYEG
jgi:predicted MPP superfamily phosphohydrolase